MARNHGRKPKQQRRPPAVADLAGRLSHYDVEALWTVLSAAGASPATRARWSTVLHLTAAAIRAPVHRSQPASAKTLPKLLRDATRAEPGLAQREDFIPEDPREIVRVRVGSELRRLFPGNIERPIADVDRALALAELFDGRVAAVHGFGITDLVQVLIGHIDQTLMRVAAAWPDGDLQLDRPSLTDSEVGAAIAAAEPELEAAEQAALAWLTRAAADVEYSASDPMSLFGTTARVLLPGEQHPRWLPLCALPEVLNQAVAELVAEAATDPVLERRFRQSVAARVRRRLWRFSPLVLGAPDLSNGPLVLDGNTAQCAVPYGRSRLLAVQMIASARHLRPRFTVPAVVTAAKAVRRGGHMLPLPEGEIGLPAESQVLPVVVAATAAHLVTPAPGDALVMSLEDLDWIASSAMQDTDLLHFAAEMTAPGQARMVSLETINAWEWWRENGGTFFRGGRRFSAMLFEQHRGSAEWHRGISWTPLEQALLLLGLPPSRAWDVVDLRTDAPTQLVSWAPGAGLAVGDEHGRHRRPPANLVTVHLGEVPTAVSSPPPSALEGVAAELFGDLPGAIGFGLQALDHLWAETCRAAAVAAVDLRLVPASSGVACDAGQTGRQDGQLHADLLIDAEALTGAADGDPAAGREALAFGLSAVLQRAGAPSGLVEEFGRAWRAAAPTLTVTSYDRVTARTSAPPPTGIERSVEAAVERTIAEAVRDSPIAPGRYGPAEAKRIDRDVLAPAAFEVLRQRLDRYRTDSVIAYGMVELERILMQQEKQLRGLDESAAHLELGWDPVQQRRQLGQMHLRLRRAAELVVEVALLPDTASTSAREIDDRGWAEVLAAGAVYLDAVGRAETLHYQLVPSGIQISDAYELQVVPWTVASDGPRVLDSDGLEQQVSADQLRAADTSAADTEWDRIAAVADAAFSDAMGATFGEVSLALLGLASWPVPDEANEAVITTVAEAVSHLQSVVPDLDEARALIALQVLISDPAEYAAEPWRPWRLRSRRTRLLTRPVPVLPDGGLVVAPHYCAAVLRIYQGYWTHGLLPWTEVPAKALRKALEEMRSHRNLQLERQVDALLRSAGWKTVFRVKVGDGARLVVPTLTTEIDVVAGKAGSTTIHLLEVKDLAPVFSPSDIRRQLEQFFDRDDSYSGKLARKTAELAPYAASIASQLGLPAAVEYSVVPRFVTRRTIPAAFAAGPYPFVALQDLLAATSSPS